MNLDNLNDKQKEAVTLTEGPLLVIAGAGSGKTRVLTTRVAYLIQAMGIDPKNILAITFTNKAAKEMKERINKMLGLIANQIQISTFHSFGLLLIKENAAKLGYKSNFTIIDADDALTLIRHIMKESNIDSEAYNPKAIRSYISSAKNELISPAKYGSLAKGDFEEKVLTVYKKYQAKLKDNNSLDFDDLLMQPIVLLQNEPALLKHYQDQYKYILVDEYQDTNQAQYTLVKMLGAKYQNVCVVGDESQAIYSWRGANYRNILNFESDYKHAKTILLEENYRSTKMILNAANDVIKHNKERKDKKLWTANEEGEPLIYHRAMDEKDEAYYVVNEIKKLITNGTSKDDIAILYRMNAQSRNLEEAMIQNNIPYKVIGSFYFYNRKEIKDLIAYLKLIYNQNDDNSLLRIINTPKRGIGLKTLTNLQLEASDKHLSLYETINSGKELAFKSIIEQLIKKSETLTLTELVDEVLDLSGLKKELETEKSLEADIKLENLEEFKSITSSYEKASGDVSLAEFLMEISLVSDIEEHKDNKDVVTMMTIHSAKGLEFKYVFIVGLEEGIFPHMSAMDSSEELEEERRLCYVAITRSKKQVWLINARHRLLYGKDMINPCSRFVNEISDKYLTKDSEDHFVKIEEAIDTTATYEVGDKVNHSTFGNGIIVSVDDSILTIAFPHPFGIRKLIKGHKSIKKVKK